MDARATDRLLGAILIAVSAIWVWVVLASIEPSDWAPVGARGFPLVFGIGLGILGAILLWQGVRGSGGVDDGERSVIALVDEVWSVAVTIGLLVLYTLLLKYSGFLIGTFLTVLFALGGLLRIRRAGLVLGVAIGLSLGIYLIMGKLLGVYLPSGTWINLGF